MSYPERAGGKTGTEAWFTPGRWLAVALLVLLTAAAFRLVALRDVPPGLAQDEVLDADIALFIRGGEHALFFRHGYGHEPLYHYFAVPFQILLGDNLLSVRLPAAALGMVLVALVLRWARREFGTVVAVFAGLGVAVSWWPVIFSRIGIRPIMEPVLLLLAVSWWPLRAAAEDERSMVRAVGAGLALGLTFYTYTAARVLFLLPVGYLVYLALMWAGRRRRGREGWVRAQIRYALVVLVLAGIVYAPMGLTLWARPELQQRVDQLAGPLEALRAGDWSPVLEMTLATLGVFSFTGDPRWTYAIPDRPIFDVAMSLLFYAGLGIALWRIRRPVYAFLLIWLGVTLLPSALTPDAPSTVRLVGAIPVVFLLPGLAVAKVAEFISGNRPRPGLVGWGLAAALVVVLSFHTWRTVRDGFIWWPAERETYGKYQTVLRDIAMQINDGSTASPVPVVADGFYEPIDDSSLDRNAGHDVGARWIQSGSGVAGALVWPGGGAMGIDLFVPEYAPLDGTLRRAAGLADTPAYRSDAPVSFARYSLPSSPPTLEPVVETRFSAVAGDMPGLTLRAAGTPEAGGGVVEFMTLWQVDDMLPPGVAIFVHLLDEAGTIVTQHDGLDAAAATLRPGDVVLQRHVLPLPERVPAGALRLTLGLYDRVTEQRWFAAAGEDSYLLALCATDNDELLMCRLAQ